MWVFKPCYPCTGGKGLLRWGEKAPSGAGSMKGKRGGIGEEVIEGLPIKMRCVNPCGEGGYGQARYKIVI